MPKLKAKNPNRVRAGRRSKAKGSAAEREIANDLEARYGDMSLPIMQRNFRRTPMSGGFRANAPGDIVVPDWFPFAIESKKYDTAADVLDLSTLPHKGDDHQLLKWWDEEYPKALMAGKELIIAFRKGRNKALVLIKHEVLLRLDRHLARGVTKENVLVMTIRNTKHDLVCVPYTTLFNRASKEALTELNRYLQTGAASVIEHQEKINFSQTTGADQSLPLQT